MNSVVAEAEEWPPHLKLAPSNENTVTIQAFVQCTEALFFGTKIGIFTPVYISMQILRQKIFRENTSINLK